MIIVLILIAVTIGISLIAAFSDQDAASGVVAFLVTASIIGIFVVIAVSDSFDSAVKIDSIQEGIVAEHRFAIDLYQDRAVIHIDKAITDFKYNGYQHQLGTMIKELRDKVTEHNQMLVSKRKYKASPFFSWLIVMPDNDRLIHVVENSQESSK